MSQLVGRFGWGTTLVSSLAMAATALALLPLTTEPAVLILLMAACGFGIGLGQPMSVTWSPLANFSATVSYRLRMDENDLDRSEWEQTTHSPSLSLWYAPTEKLNLTFAYNYLGQRSEAKFCQGWYDG